MVYFLPPGRLLTLMIPDVRCSWDPIQSLLHSPCHYLGGSEPQALAAPLIRGDLRAARHNELKTLPFPSPHSHCPEETMPSPLAESVCRLQTPRVFCNLSNITAVLSVRINLFKRQNKTKNLHLPYLRKLTLSSPFLRLQINVLSLEILLSGWQGAKVSGAVLGALSGLFDLIKPLFPCL